MIKLNQIEFTQKNLQRLIRNQPPNRKQQIISIFIDLNTFPKSLKLLIGNSNNSSINRTVPKQLHQLFKASQTLKQNFLQISLFVNPAFLSLNYLFTEHFSEHFGIFMIQSGKLILNKLSSCIFFFWICAQLRNYYDLQEGTELLEIILCKSGPISFLLQVDSRALIPMPCLSVLTSPSRESYILLLLSFVQSPYINLPKLQLAFLMNSSNFSQNWQQLPLCMQELEALQNYANPQQLSNIYMLRDKAVRCDNLKNKLQVENKQLKAEFLHLLLEKQLYGRIVKNICQLGSKLNWEPEVLRKAKPLIDSIKAQLASKGNRTTQVEKKQRE